MIGFIKFLFVLCLGAALIYGAFYFQERIKEFFSAEEAAVFAPVEPRQVILGFPDEVTLTNTDGVTIDVLLLARNESFVQFERRSDNKYFKYAISYLNTESQAIVRNYEDTGLFKERDVNLAGTLSKEEGYLIEKIEKIDVEVLKLKAELLSGVGDAAQRTLRREITDLIIKQESFRVELEAIKSSSPEKE